MRGKVEIIKEKNLFSGYLKIWEGEIRHTENGKENHYTREKLVREDAVSVLLYHEEKKCVILVSQFRYPIADREAVPPLETLAGKMDKKGEVPVHTALREIEEETGYAIQEKELIPLTTFYSSSGYTSERVYLYFAKVNSRHQINQGGGRNDEQEFIEVIEMPLENYLDEIKNGKIKDAKTIIAGLMAKEKECF